MPADPFGFTSFDGGRSCNTRIRCRIVSLDLGRLVLNRANALGLGEAATSEQEFPDPLPISILGSLEYAMV